LMEFQSHEPEFDYLKSLEIEEKINKIRWCKRTNPALFLLSTNDKTIKLWKVHEKYRQVVTSRMTGRHSDNAKKSDGSNGMENGVQNGPELLRLPFVQHFDDRIRMHMPITLILSR
jgi:serine/threonine-protein phosphatase 2A regulatory subunit B